MGEGAKQLAFGNLRQQVSLLCFTAGDLHGTAEQDHGGKVGLQHQCLAEGLHQNHGFHRTAAKAAMVLGEGHAQETQIRVLLPQLAAPAVGRPGVGLPLFEAVTILQQPVHTFLEHPLLFA